MTENQALAYIHGLAKHGIRPGLARMREALTALGEPQRRLRVVHIAGTNGKGSTAKMIQSIATANGWRTGLYTSPTVTTLADTITIDSVPIPADTLAALTERLQTLPVELTEFEFVTVLTLLWFAEERVDLAVIECGLGGSEDATNVFSAPLAAVFTPISLDHTQLLGETLEEIAANKAGIIKPPCAVISSPDQPPEALGEILETAARMGLTVRIPARGCKAPALSMNGAHQRSNALTAIETIEALRERGYPISDDAVAAGLTAAVLPCRQELLQWEIPVLLDGAHNPKGIEALAETIREYWPDTHVVLLTGMLADKDAAACAAILQPLADKVICCTPNHSNRALAADMLAGYYPGAIVEPDIAAALQRARTIASSENLPLVVAGSFYVAAEVRKA